MKSVPMLDVSIDVTSSLSRDGSPSFTVALDAPAVEICICLSMDDCKRLAQVTKTPWDNGSIQIGESAGAKVFWSCDSHVVNILIGDDDQTWDIGIFIPESAIEEIMRQIRACERNEAV
jgi:hypothetical protein